jgi:hypothetical protein
MREYDVDQMQHFVYDYLLISSYFSHVLTSDDYIRGDLNNLSFFGRVEGIVPGVISFLGIPEVPASVFKEPVGRVE